MMPDDAVRIEAPATRDAAADVVARIMEAVEEADYGKTSTFAIRLALEEAISNAIKHGSGEEPGHPITIEFHVDRDRVVISIEDRGRGFDPGAVPDPTLEENIERPSGRGIMLMRAYMTEVAYNERGNRVSLRYERPG